MFEIKKNITVFAIVAVAGLVATTFVFVATIRPQQSAQAIVQEPPAEGGDGLAMLVIEPESFVQETGKSAVKSYVASEQISVKRGSSAVIEVMAKHIGGANADQSINVKVLPPVGYKLYPPSVAKSTTPEQRAEAAGEHTILQGGIDLGLFVSVNEPDGKAILKSDEKAFDVLISVPGDLPDELLGEIYIPLNIDATDSSGNAIPGEGTGIIVVVS